MATGQLGFLAIIVGLVVQVFIPGYPKEGLLIQAGANYGLLGGFVINWIGMVLGAQLAYEVTRRSVETGGRYSRIIKQYEGHRLILYLERRGIMGLLVIRLLPNAPNDVLSLLSGGLKLQRMGFILVSIITAIPYALLFAYFGDLGKDYIKATYLMIFNIGLFIITGIVSTVYYIRNHETSADDRSTNSNASNETSPKLDIQ